MLLSQLLFEVTITSCRSSAGILHGCLQQNGAPSHTARNTTTYLRRENVTFIEPHMWLPNARTWIQSTSIVLFGVPFNRWFINVDDSRQSTSWSRQSSVSGTNYCSVSSIAPLVSGIAGLSGSSRSKANKLNIWRIFFAKFTGESCKCSPGTECTPRQSKWPFLGNWRV